MWFAGRCRRPLFRFLRVSAATLEAPPLAARSATSPVCVPGPTGEAASPNGLDWWEAVWFDCAGQGSGLGERERERVKRGGRKERERREKRERKRKRESAREE